MQSHEHELLEELESDDELLEELELDELELDELELLEELELELDELEMLEELDFAELLLGAWELLEGQFKEDGQLEDVSEQLQQQSPALE